MQDRDTGAQRDVYRRTDMQRVIAPRSIAIVGASERPGSLGLRTLQNLAAFQGSVYQIQKIKYKHETEGPNQTPETLQTATALEVLSHEL